MNDKILGVATGRGALVNQKQILQIAGGPTVYALCMDGTLWQWVATATADGPSGSWLQIPAIATP